MSEESNICLDPENHTRLLNFKKIFDVIMEEELPFDEYVNVVISIGLENMLRSSIPPGAEMDTIQLLFKNKSEMVSEELMGIWKSGSEETEIEKEEVRKRIYSYIK